MKLGLAYYMRQVTSPGGTKHQIRSSSGRVRNAQSSRERRDQETLGIIYSDRVLQS